MFGPMSSRWTKTPLISDVQGIGAATIAVAPIIFRPSVDKIQTGLYSRDMGKTTASDARRRILATADRLFYAEGVHSVGVDRIIAEAEVAKMTLYNHFPSKDDLVLAVLKFREERIVEFFTKAIEKHAKRQKNQLRAFFVALKEWFESPGFRGCIFINTAAEVADPKHPAAAFAAEHKKRFHAMLADIVEELVGAAGRKVAPAVALIVEGAIVTAVMEQSSKAADVARDAALALVSSARQR